MKKLLSFLLIFCLLLGFAGCHGNVTRTEFSIPDTFDTSREYEITFWAKNDTNSTQVAIYKQAIAILKPAIPISKST